MGELADGHWLPELAEAVVAAGLDPYAAADEMLAAFSL